MLEDAPGELQISDILLLGPYDGFLVKAGAERADVWDLAFVVVEVLKHLRRVFMMMLHE